MNRIFIDMDGTSVDFDRAMLEWGLSSDTLKRMPGAFLCMQPFPGAIEGIRSLIGMGFECWMASKPPTAVPVAYADKAGWVLQFLPELKRRLILTHDKGLLGDERDYLIDDRPHKANCSRFPGTILHFGPRGVYRSWEDILMKMRTEAVARGLRAA